MPYHSYLSNLQVNVDLDAMNVITIRHIVTDLHQ